MRQSLYAPAWPHFRRVCVPGGLSRPALFRLFPDGLARHGAGSERARMKIASFNINNIKRRLPNLLEWLGEAKPDVVCLQELKATDAEFPADALRRAGYESVWRGQKTWNGVAILGARRDPDPDPRRAAG